MTDGCSECGEVRGLQKNGKCRAHSKYNDVLCPDCPVSGICSTCFTVRLPLPSRFRDFGTFSKRMLLDICGKVLDSRNENLRTGDVLGCVRDMAQLAMAVKEQPYRELVVINEHGVAHKFSGHFTLDLGFVGSVQSSRQRTHDNKGAPIEFNAQTRALSGESFSPVPMVNYYPPFIGGGAVSYRCREHMDQTLPCAKCSPREEGRTAGEASLRSAFAHVPNPSSPAWLRDCFIGPFPQDPACPLEPPFRAGQMVTSTQDPSAGYDFTVLRCRTHPTKGTWEFKAEGSAHWWKCEAFRVFAPLKAQGARE